jgi:poly-gamma-glutamate capsule biosynthesis protein CapA/YwtB (metallophosphatase superfamily)
MIIGFTGDVMLGRLVNEMIDNTGYAYPWGNTLPLMKAHDLNIINLETTLTTSRQKVPKVFNFKANPDRVKCLTEAKIDIANLANNHILDFDAEGLTETVRMLDEAGIKHVGAGKNSKEAKSPVIIIKKEIRIGIIGMTDNEPGWKASNEKPGTNFLEVGNISEAKPQIQTIRNHVDVLILTLHWGPNKREFPNGKFIHFAHELIESGVDIIHGHSAHIFQGIEVYKEKPILYDTGDFIDDYAVDPYLRNDYSFLFEVELEKNRIEKLTLIPVVINNMQVNKASKKDFQSIVSKFKFRTTIYKTVFKEKKDRLEVVVNE